MVALPEGQVLTRPLRFSVIHLEIDYSTSAAGEIRVGIE